MNAEMRKILVPLDGSPQAEAGLEAARPLVGTFDAELLILKVIEHPEDGGTPAYHTSAVKSLRAEGVKASLLTREGKAAEEILACAAERAADLIAMSTHGRTGMSRLLIGSVAEAVLRRAQVPVLLSRPGMRVRPWKQIAVALDGSERAEAILPEAARLAKAHKAALDVVKVALPIVSGASLGEVPMIFPSEDPMPYLRSVCGRLAAQGVEARPVSLEGRAASEVIRHAAATEAGLICMTTHGRTGLVRVLLGSIAEEIVRHAPCPVLVRRAARVEAPAGA
jgi:nucleotide-binding universal stress UspA family protein